MNNEELKKSILHLLTGIYLKIEQLENRIIELEKKLDN